MAVEISQMQRLIVLLGHPTYSLSVVLFSLLVSSGMGSYFSEKIATTSKERIILLSLVLTLFGFGKLTPLLITEFQSSGLVSRIVLACLILMPIGFFMGTAFPFGIQAASRRHNELTPWLWGINGATSVAASVIVIPISLVYGISISFWVGFFFYCCALLAFWLFSRKNDKTALASTKSNTAQD